MFLAFVACVSMPMHALAVKFTLQEVVIAEGVKYSLQKYLPGISIFGCPWRQAAPLFAESTQSAKIRVNGSGCWIEDASRGEIIVWIENQSGNDITKKIYRNSDADRPNAIISNVEKWHKTCEIGNQDTNTACENRRAALDYLRKHGWCWAQNATEESGKRWVRCDPKL